MNMKYQGRRFSRPAGGEGQAQRQPLIRAAAEAFAELLDQYNAARHRAEAALGSRFNESDFHAWFTAQAQRAGGAA